MLEFVILGSYLLVGFILAPLMTNSFFLKGSRIYSRAHKLSLVILLAAYVLNVNELVAVWPLFCVFGFFLYLKTGFKFSVSGLTTYIPFVFSLISAVWLVSAVLDLRLLGYGREWSFFAALHGSFVGWIFAGCLAYLSKRHRYYLWGSYLSFVFFLFVAFGIDGAPHLKRVGVIGFAAMVPFVTWYYARNLPQSNDLSKRLARISLAAVFLSMALAVLNEFWVGFPRLVYDLPVMVVTHGFLNAVFAIPCFYLAIHFEAKSFS